MLRRYCLFLIATLFSFHAFAQTSGEITGIVTDPSGSAIPGSTITLTNTATNAVRTMESNGEGLYRFTPVPPGVYTLKVEHQGFKAANTSNIEVQVQQTVRLDLTLQVGQVTESVEVSASAALLQSENATVGSVIENKAIVELPLNGRNYLNLVNLAPNVSNLAPSSGQAGSRQGGDRAGQAVAAGGNRIVYNYFTLDGVTNTDVNFNTYIVLPSIDALQEFKVQTGVYPAEFGHAATQINVLTKSGGNAYHGSLFEFLRNDFVDASPYSFTAIRQVKPPFKWNDYGFELDGPVSIPKVFNGKDKLFFMANYEALRQRQKTQGTYNVPTAAMFRGDFSQYGSIIHDPATKLPFQGNIIPANRISPFSQALLKYYNSSTLPGLTNNYVQDQASPMNQDRFVVRMDYVESAKSTWSGRYSWGDENQSNQSINASGTKITTNYEQYMGSNTRILTPNLVNETRFGYSRFYNALGTLSAFNTDIVAQLNLPNLPTGAPVTWGIPRVTMQGNGFSNFGDVTDGPFENSNNTAQFINNLSWTKGKHSFKFGFEVNRQNFNQVGNQFSRGEYVYQANSTRSANNTGGDAFAEFLLGAPFQSTIALQIAEAKFQRNTMYGFVDDTWKVTPKLTVSLGLRYELTPPFVDQLNKLFAVYVPKIYNIAGAPAADSPFFVRQGNCSNAYTADPAISVRWTGIDARCSNGLLPDGLMKTRYNDFAPRFGIAYSPDSKTVIRAGFGTFFSQDNANSPFFDLARNLAARNSNFATTGLANIGYNNAFPASAGGTLTLPARPYTYSDTPEHHTAYSMQYIVNVQRQFGENWSVEVGYMGSQSRHLAGFMNKNEGIPSPVGTALSHIPFANFGYIQTVDDAGMAVYNSLTGKVTRRFSNGLSLIAAYTHAVAIDTTSAIRIQGYDTLFPQNSYCRKCERALSSFDTRDRLVVSPLYELPIGKGKMLNITNPVMNAIAGGWQVGGILTLQSGIPATINIGGQDNSLTQSTYDRPNATGLASAATNPGTGGWYNRAAYVVAPVGSFGNVGRNSATSPGIYTVNAEVHKNIRMPYNERHQLQFRAEAFNLFNHPVWGEPQRNILAGAAIPGAPANAAHAGFGVISGLLNQLNGFPPSIPMRQIQLGLKYTF